MLYVIGETDYNFIRIEYETMWDGGANLWNEVKRVEYGCFIESATIINGHDRAKEVLEEIQNRISEIRFSDICLVGQIIAERNGFDKVAYAKRLKIFELVPTPIED